MYGLRKYNIHQFMAKIKRDRYFNYHKLHIFCMLTINQ